jgi:ribonuclease VapC
MVDAEPENRIYVIDASAVLAVVLAEPGAELVKARGRRNAVSTVNVAEIRSRLVDLGFAQEDADEALALVKFEEYDFTSEQARTVATLRAQTRQAGLSIGDRACLALASELGAVALTADKQWKSLALDVEVELIR